MKKNQAAEDIPLMKALFGGKLQNLMMLLFFLSMAIFFGVAALSIAEKIEVTVLVKVVLYGTGLTMVAVLVILPFSLFKHMIRNKKG